MTPIRSSSRWTLAYALVAAGCARAEPASFPSTDAWAPARRRPDGVAVDPVSLDPTASRRGRTDAVGPVVLSPPLAASLAQKTVIAFFDAVVRRDEPGLFALLSERATWTNPSIAGRGSVQAIGVWHQRLLRGEYALLASVPVVREAELEVYAEGELDAALPGRPARPAEMTSSDVLVRARIVTPRIGADRLLGDEVVFLLRPEGGRYRITLLFEDFQLP